MLFAQEVPYKTYFVPNVTIDPPGHGAFASSSGDVVLGLKVNLFSEERDDLMGFAVRMSHGAVEEANPGINSSYLQFSFSIHRW